MEISEILGIYVANLIICKEFFLIPEEFSRIYANFLITNDLIWFWGCGPFRRCHSGSRSQGCRRNRRGRLSS